MAKRRHAVGKMKKAHNSKTKKRLEAKKLMLEVKSKKKRK